MLNEIALAKQYLEYLNVNQTITTRIKRQINLDNDNNKIIGIKSILSFVARYYIYDKGYSPLEVRYILSSYCGILDITEFSGKAFDINSLQDETLKADILNVKDAFPNALLNMKSTSTNKAKSSEEIIAANEKIKEIFIKNAIYYNYDKAINDKSSNDFVSFIRIISEAIALGPLKNRYLCISKDSLLNLINGDNDLSNYLNNLYKRSSKVPTFDRMIKTLAVYKIKKLDNNLNKLDKLEFIYVPKYELEDYYNSSIFGDGYLKSLSSRKSKNNELPSKYAFFKKDANSNVLLISPCEPLKQLNSKLVDEQDFNENINKYKDYYIFRDIDGSDDIITMSELNENNEFNNIDISELFPSKKK